MLERESLKGYLGKLGKFLNAPTRLRGCAFLGSSFGLATLAFL